MRATSRLDVNGGVSSLLAGLLAGLLALCSLTACSSEPTTVTGTQSAGQASGDDDTQASAATSAAESASGTTTTAAPATSAATTGSATTTTAAPGTTSASSTSAAPAGGTSYTNAKYGFTAQIPAGYTRSESVPGDRGLIYSGPAGVVWKVYGSANADEPARTCHLTADALSESAQMSMSGNTCTITATAGTRTSKLVGWIGTASANWLDVSYPNSAASTVQPLIQQATASFKTGDLSKAH